MKKHFLIVLNIAFAMNLTAQDFNGNYPDTKKIDQIDDFFGTQLNDPYRWLEDD